MTYREQYTPGLASGAQVRKDGENWTLILVRELRHSPEMVWEALTDPAHLREWAPFDADGSLATVGTTVKLTTVGAPAQQVSETRVTRADAPKVLEYNWGDKNIRWELEAFGGGTRLTLWHNIDRRFISMGAAGWHICFDVLDRLLSGTPIGRIVGAEAMKFGWPRLNAEYARQFGAREERLRDRVSDLRQEIERARRDSRETESSLDGGNLKSGETFAQRYEIIAVLGRGGMGTVYRAKDLELEEEVAIKTLRPEVVADKTLLARFKDEIRLARRLTDKNIVRTHDFGEWSGVYFLTMECVQGITARELIDTRGRLGVSATLAIAAQLARSLAVAHEHGVIHRDIKPQNLLVDEAGVLKVMDFGVARLAERSTANTEAGLVLGTPAYMPPEQLMGEPVDARSDLYAAGVVLYECLTGKLPFEAGSVISSLAAKLLTEEARPPQEVNPEIPPVLSALVMRLLAKRPEERVQTAADLGTQLAALG